MLDMAELYLYEVGKNGREVVPAQMVLLFNRAQDRLISMLKRNIVRDLDVTVTAQSLGSSGEFDLTGLTCPVWRGTQGIDGVKLTGGRFCKRISFDEYRLRNDLGDAFTADHPAWYARGTNIYVLPHSGYAIDIYYMREPARMALGNGGGDTDCELDEMFHGLIVGLALEDFADLDPAIMRFYNKTIADIRDLNGKYPVSDSLNDGYLRNNAGTHGRFDFLNI